MKPWLLSRCYTKETSNCRNRSHAFKMFNCVYIPYQLDYSFRGKHKNKVTCMLLRQNPNKGFAKGSCICKELDEPRPKRSIAWFLINFSYLLLLNSLEPRINMPRGCTSHSIIRLFRPRITECEAHPGGNWKNTQGTASNCCYLYKKESMIIQCHAISLYECCPTN